MKVLMFGWEFPPHISGGLGTACFGLTQSLMKEKARVLFVVPRLFGDESKKGTLLINASLVTNGKETQTRATSKSGAGVAKGFFVKSSSGGTRREGITHLEIPAVLSPYESPGSKQQEKTTVGLKSWNYSITSEVQSDPYAPITDLNDVEMTEAEENGDALRLSGTYGNNLMEEVKHYAKVAGIIAKKYSFDIIHAHDWMTFLASVVAKRGSKKPLIVHVHSTEFDRAGNQVNETVFEIEKLGFTEADRIIAVSNRTKQIVMSRYKIPGEKIQVIHNGILPKEKTEEFFFPEIGSHFVTFLGRVTHQKGPGFFVEAAQKVLQEFPEAHFIVAGAGDLLPQIIERVAQLNMGGNFHFTGFVSGNQVDQIWSQTAY